jgi:alpha-N-arabinofuranosidase
MHKITLRPQDPQHKINKHIYGHFAEHLGGCIYDGLYVGENADIPNTRGWRNDIIEALRAINIPNLRWPVRTAD